MAFERHICCCHIYGYSMVNIDAVHCFVTVICAVILGLYVDHSSSVVEHVRTVWHVYLFRGQCQYCKMYVYQSSFSHCCLHWLHMRHIYCHRCIVCAHEPIGTDGLYIAFEVHISFCQVNGNNMMLVVPQRHHYILYVEMIV